MMGGDEILRKRYPEPEWIVPGFVLDRGVSALYAAIGKRKSTFALQLCRAIAGRHEFLGQLPRKTGKILYYALEDNDARIHLRMKQQGWTTEEAKRAKFLFELAPIGSGAFDQLADVLATVDPVLAVIDPLYMAAGAKLDLNKASQVGDMMRKFKGIVREVQTSLLVVHHTRKVTKYSPGGNLDEDASGSGALAALTDVRMEIHNSPMAVNSRLLVSGKDRAYQEILMRFDTGSWTWKLAEDVAGGDSLRSRVFVHIKEHGSSSATSVAERLGEDRGNVAKELIRLSNEGKLTREKKGREVQYVP